MRETALPAVRVEHLSKRFRLVARPRWSPLRWRRRAESARDAADAFWAGRAPIAAKNGPYVVGHRWREARAPDAPGSET